MRIGGTKKYRGVKIKRAYNGYIVQVGCGILCKNLSNARKVIRTINQNKFEQEVDDLIILDILS